MMQLFYSYGLKTNRRFLLSYGFTIDNNYSESNEYLNELQVILTFSPKEKDLSRSNPSTRILSFLFQQFYSGMHMKGKTMNRDTLSVFVFSINQSSSSKDSAIISSYIFAVLFLLYCVLHCCTCVYIVAPMMSSMRFINVGRRTRIFSFRRISPIPFHWTMNFWFSSSSRLIACISLSYNFKRVEIK